MPVDVRCRSALVLLRKGTIFFAAALLSGCAGLPNNGPTGLQVRHSVQDTKNTVNFKIVELDSFGAVPAAPARPKVFQPKFDPPPTDLIGDGDLLDIAVYEAGVTLFGGNGNAAVTGSGGFETSSKVERLPPIKVNDQGFIQLPYIGTMRAIGLTTAELAASIRRQYKGMSQDPQVLVSLRNSLGNSIIVAGEVGKPGRLVLETNRETISDVIALAGGYRSEAKDITVKIQREDQDAEYRLSDIMGGEFSNLRVYPGDKISLVRAPRSFAVLGASGRIEQISFSGPSVNLAEAIALAGGVNPNSGDAKAIFVFRLVSNEGQPDTPIVYHLNMMKPTSYFISQRFAMINKDVIYFGNASANQPSKLIQLVSQLFSPVVTVISVAQASGL